MSIAEPSGVLPIVAVGLFCLLSSPAAHTADSDSDGVDDLLDNCVSIANGPLLTSPAGGASQVDRDRDGFGDRCDGDYNNNGQVNAQDKLIFYDYRSAGDIRADISGNGYVNAQDTALFTSLLGSPPGPGAKPPCSAGGSWPTECAFHGDNPYDWDVFASHPDCTATAGNILHITSNAHWDLINSSAYTVFCVAPGDYRAWSQPGNIVLELTRDGTPAKPRWIVLYDPANPADRTHPARLAEARRAIMPHFRINGGDYWQIVRMTVRQYSQQDDLQKRAGEVLGTRGVRFSHMLIEGGKKSGFPYVVRGNGVANGNYIFQYNVHRNVERVVNEDRVAFYLEDCAQLPCNVVRNEIYNSASDAITVAGANYTGGIRIDENEMYMTDVARTDCMGVPSPTGDCASNESMVVFKDPRSEPATTSYVTNNVIHDSYELDGYICCSQTGNATAHAINIGSGTSGPLTNVTIENNVIFNSSGGIVFKYDGDNIGAKGLLVRRNLLFGVRSRSSAETALATWLGVEHTEIGNVMVGADHWLGTTSFAGSYKTHRCNVVLDGGTLTPAYSNSGGSWGNNYRYGSTPEPAVSGVGYLPAVGPAPALDSAGHGPFCVVTRFLTNPTQVCLARGKVTSASPHFLCVP